MIFGYFAAYSFKISTVPSVEAPSMTISSKSEKVCETTVSNVSLINRSSLRTAQRIDIKGFVNSMIFLSAFISPIIRVNQRSRRRREI